MLELHNLGNRSISCSVDLAVYWSLIIRCCFLSKLESRLMLMNRFLLLYQSAKQCKWTNCRFIAQELNIHQMPMKAMGSPLICVLGGHPVLLLCEGFPLLYVSNPGGLKLGFNIIVFYSVYFPRVFLKILIYIVFLFLVILYENNGQCNVFRVVFYERYHFHIHINKHLGVHFMVCRTL